MTISAALVKELRERTGAGMMECKTALVEANGDLDAAGEVLRISGQAKADKKASRIAAEGRVVVAETHNAAVIVEINSETDFVAKDENFVAFTDAVAAAALQSSTQDVAELVAQKLATATRLKPLVRSSLPRLARISACAAWRGLRRMALSPVTHTALALVRS